ncbi:hypothetical protein M9H77_14534 [Catharanthus roseus]|uniref:Uncharacterized protein n=1 Tax=Catharanthus roseus TaxID=4058 RepID=A0ACC0BNE1_CATRO|nr:hypothetical protein M9H77_14534 [Catharanthus roseus]
MDHFEESLQENVGFEGDEDPNTFEEFLDLEEYIDLGYLFTTDWVFGSKDKLVEWAKQIAVNAKTYLIITWYQRAKTFDRRPYVTLPCERGGSLKGKQMATSENWQLFVQNRRHNHKLAVYITVMLICKTYGGAVATDRTVQEESCSTSQYITIFPRTRRWLCS